MQLTSEEKEMLDGGQGKAVQKAMQILASLGTIYGAERMIPVSSVQIAGVS
jgi:predicted aconitase